MGQRERTESEARIHAEQLTSVVNNMNSDVRNEVIRLMLREHRTIQQNFMRFVMTYIEGMAAKRETNDHDLRNEASVTLANEILAKVDNRALPYV